jgi:hypothetical protein
MTVWRWLASTAVLFLIGTLVLSGELLWSMQKHVTGGKTA